MLRKSIILLMCYQLCFGFVTTDPTSYIYFMQQIQQMTKMLNAATTQIKTLGGIRTAMDETKRQIYNTKDNLDGAFSNLQSAMKDLQEATNNAEVKSLFDTGRDSIKSNSSEGILYKNITNEIQSYFNQADRAVMNDLDVGKMNDFQENLKKTNSALSSNSSEEFMRKINTINFEEVNKNILIKDYLSELKKKGKEAVQQLALKQNNDLWLKHLFPNEKQEEEQKVRKERLDKYISYIENSSDIYQQTQTTNMLLIEVIRLLKEEYDSAINFRNSMALLFLGNTNNQQFLNQLKKNREAYSRLKKGQDVEIDNLGLDRIKNLPKSNPFGIGYRPYK